MGTHRVAFGGLVVYLGALGAVALWPQPVDRPFSGMLLTALTLLHRRGIPGWMDYSFVESASNVLLFIPLGALVARLAGRGHWWVGAAAGLLTSCAVELAQFLFLPGRYATFADILANTFGALLGAQFTLSIRRRRGPVGKSAPASTL